MRAEKLIVFDFVGEVGVECKLIVEKHIKLGAAGVVMSLKSCTQTISPLVFLFD